MLHYIICMPFVLILYSRLLSSCSSTFLLPLHSHLLLTQAKVCICAIAYRPLLTFPYSFAGIVARHS
jgi:hypothetical protein